MFDGRAEAFVVHQERVVPLDGGKHLWIAVDAVGGEPFADLTLLVRRPQKVGLDTDDLRRLDVHALESALHIRVAFADVIQVDGP